MPFRYDLLFGILIPSVIIVALLIVGAVYVIRRQNRKIVSDKITIERDAMAQEFAMRYSVMPKKYVSFK